MKTVKKLSKLRLAVLSLAMGVLALPSITRAQAGLPPMGDEYRNSGYPEAFSGNTFYPATELRAVPVARARVLATRELTRQAYSALTNSVQDIRRSYEDSAELRDALAEERAAWNDLEIARKAALTRVSNDRNYQTAVALRSRLATEVENHKAEQDRPVESAVALAMVKLSYSATASAMETAAISSDLRVQQARERLVQAGARLSELRRTFAATVRNDAAVTAARRALEIARVNELAAEGFYIEARANRLWATNYAYYLAQPIGQSAYYNGYPYGYGGYGGYGGGFGYPIGWRR